jgi:hypothetical protein
MFSLSTSPVFFQRIGLLLLTAQFSLFVFALPPFHTGVWVQTEPVVLALYGFAALTGLWLALGAAKKWLIAQPANALWNGMLLWTLWQLVATLFASSPYRSWFGPPQTGEGAAWHVAALLNFMLATALWQELRWRRMLLWVASGNIVILSLLYTLDQPDIARHHLLDSWTPVQYPAHLAFYVGYVWIAATSTLVTKNWRTKIASVLAMVIVLWVSKNQSAQILLGGGLVVCMLGFAPKAYFRDYFYRFMLSAGCILPLMWVIFSVWMGQHPLLYDKDSALGSRIVLNQVAVATMMKEPSRWLVGDGWGGFADAIFNNILVNGIEVYQHGTRLPNCSMVDGGAYHSHSQPLEALMSSGILGLLLWLAIPLLALRSMSGHHLRLAGPMLVGLNALGFFWFQIAECVPFQMLALASIAQSSSKRSHRRWPAMVLVAASLVMAFSAMQQASVLQYTKRMEDMVSGDSQSQVAMDWLINDARNGSDRLRSVAPVFMAKFINSPSGVQQTNGIAAFMNLTSNIMNLTSSLAQHPSVSPQVTYLELLLPHYLLAESEKKPLLPNALLDIHQTIPEAALHVARKSPLRDDLASPLLDNIDSYFKTPEAQIDFLKQLLAIAPNHRGALWVLGHKTNDEAMIERAKALGVAKVFPVQE